MVVFSAALMSACSSPTTSSSAEAPRQPAGKPTIDETTPTVVVAPVLEKMLEKITQLPAELVPYQIVELFPKVSSFVEWIGVDRGSRVRRGQILVRLTAPEIKSQRAEAEARLHSIQSQRVEAAAQLKSDEGTYSRLKAAASTPGVVSGNELEIAERSVEARRARLSSIENSELAAQAALKSVQEMESYLTVIAPFDGVITERNVHAGALVGPSGAAAMQPMLRLEQMSQLRLVVPIPERDVAGLARGTQVTFRVPAFPAESFQAVIRRIAHSVDPKTRTMAVELDVSNASGRLPAGMFAEVSWPVKRANKTLFVPPSAVVTTTERTFVIRVKDGVADWIDVRRGATLPDLLEVFGDLQAGDRVVLRGSDELRPGTRIQIANN
jgi:RND family efflux transporter MFP subunit